MAIKSYSWGKAANEKNRGKRSVGSKRTSKPKSATPTVKKAKKMKPGY
jgi:hypothetical protein|tara:strand:+ start:11999 stop:12142 length:144 start_codon:yes stop_codon:yes gene_type:complete